MSMEKELSQGIHNPLVSLQLNILHAEGIDEPNLHPSVGDRSYCVVLWVMPGREFYTNTVMGMLNPIWNSEGVIFLRNLPDKYTFLYLEVLRLNSVTDPGTSNGVVVVGRAKIPLPKNVNCKKSGRFGLVRVESGRCKAEGHIILSMELKRCKNK
ncbi:uncharacterized protein LOC113874487 [Abrus precatorius]|uniref:Uncharacterized protein LOC113874487 n=1 Tax=Abrus precatorius TaxID=3816 RepID=A0A8B8MMP5_ABRPR|nr:uncharacterized protein LOC113874487 [Abrus precatorius]